MYYYLAHHGIEGMKWGQRNGPPYPLNYYQYSSAERKEMKKDGRRIEKDINDASREEAQAAYKTNVLSKRADKIQKKLNRSIKSDEKHGIISNKTNKLQAKHKAASKVFSDALKDETRLRKNTAKYLDELTKKGYGVDAKEVRMATAPIDGKEAASRILTSGLITAATAAGVHVTAAVAGIGGRVIVFPAVSVPMIKRTKYNVKVGGKRKESP